MAEELEVQQMWAVVCVKLHVSFGPFREEMNAAEYADRLSTYSRNQAVEQGKDPEQACVYSPVVMWVQSNRISNPKFEGRLN